MDQKRHSKKLGMLKKVSSNYFCNPLGNSAKHLLKPSESAELCEQDDKRVEVIAAAAGKDCKVVAEREDSGNGNRESPSH